MPRIALLLSLLPFTISAAVAAPADPALWAPRMADAYLAMTGRQDNDPQANLIHDDMNRLADALRADPLFAELAAPAFVQAATLAHQGSVPATRGAAYDLARDILLTAATLSPDQPDSFAPLRDWHSRDPLQAELVAGQGLAASDIAALDQLKRLGVRAGLDVIPAGDSTAQMMQLWADNAENPADRIFPSRFQAWANGVSAAWPGLDESEREVALTVLFRPEIPSQSLLKKVLGTGDILNWLAATDLPMNLAERENSRELRLLMQTGAFAGPLNDMAVMGTGSENAALDAATTQLMRLNNHSAATGEMHSWESYRQMTDGY